MFNRVKYAFSVLLLSGALFGAEVLYGGKPVNVSVSGKAINVIEFPANVERVNSSNKFVQIKISGKKVVVKVPEDEEVDLYALTEDGSDYLLYLIPEDRPPEIIKVINTVKRKSERAAEFEKSNEYENLIAKLIAAVLNGRRPVGYEKTVRTFTVETPVAIFVFLEEYSGWQYKVVKAQIINKANRTLRVREDMKFIRQVLRNTYGGLYAVALTKEFLAPVSQSINDASSLLIAVVPNKKVRSMPVTELDRIIKEFLSGKK